MREATHNTIGRIKDIPNEKKNIFERHKRNLIEAQQNMGQDALNIFSKLTRMKAAIPLKKGKAAKKVERHSELKMKLVCKFDKSGALIKDKDGLIN